MTDQNGAGDAGKTGAADGVAAAAAASAKAGAAGSGAGDKSGAGAAGDKSTSSASGSAATGDKAGTGDTGGAGAAGKTGEGTDKTILKEGGTDKNVVAGDWPTDWRQKMAGDDKKLLDQLGRFASPLDLAKKIREQDALIAAGAHKKPLAKDATPEQIAAFRKENGIPDAPDKYDLTLPDGLTVGEEDKPIVAEMLKTMHNLNLSNDAVKQVMASYYEQERAFMVAREEAIKTNKTEQDDALHKQWGDDYRDNIKSLQSLNRTFTKETQDALAGAVGSDGFPLLNNKHFLNDLAAIARQVNPIDVVVSGGAGNQMQSVDEEISGFEKRFGSPDQTVRDAWFKDEKSQKRHRELLEWKERNKKAP